MFVCCIVAKFLQLCYYVGSTSVCLIVLTVSALDENKKTKSYLPLKGCWGIPKLPYLFYEKIRQNECIVHSSRDR